MMETTKKKKGKKKERIIALCGRISSGKTTLAQQISDRYNVPIASFGGFIKNYCEKNNLPSDRKSLQDIGKKFITKPTDFLKDVMQFYDSPSDVTILEGIRHRVILKKLSTICKQDFVVFVDADDNTIHDRYAKREKDIDVEKEYKTYDAHPVEFEVEQLKILAHFIYHSNNQDAALFKALDTFLEKECII